jgi:outer membrane protein assembly factor BamB
MIFSTISMIRFKGFGWFFLTMFILVAVLGLIQPGAGAVRAAQRNQSNEWELHLPLLGRSVRQNSIIRTGSPTEWTQDAHDAQRTGYIAEEPLLPWTLLWTWNGPDESGGIGGHFYDAPREARTITGGNHVYVPAGDNGLYALTKEEGRQAWRITATSFLSAPAYDPATGHLYAGGWDGQLYKIDASTGQILNTYSTGGILNKSVLIVPGFAYVVTQSGDLHKINTASMSGEWVYRAGSDVATPPAYSSIKGLLVYVTADLYVHAVRDADGSSQWRVKPTPHPARSPYTFDGYWPVIAEQHGVVFVRMNLGIHAMWSGPITGEWGAGVFPMTNTEIRAFLQGNNGIHKNLFALNLDDGREKFIPAVGYGGVEGWDNGETILETGPVPVVKLLPDGSEVAYTHFRNGQGNPQDGRWDSHMGEMVLDDYTVPGLVAGDMRFVDFHDAYVIITDEQGPVTMAGNTLFHAHWGASESTLILDRSHLKGLSYSDPISSEKIPTVIRRIQSTPGYNPHTHWTTSGLTLFGDTRFWPPPGWWVYWNVLDPPTPTRSAYSGGILPRYTYVSDGFVIVEGNGGDLFVLRHSGQ